MPIDVETLLNRQRIESERIEFKRGWNPAGIYRTICAFANDFENLGGGYILVGIEQDERGVAKRPVVGIEDGEIDGILKELELTEGRSTGVPTIQEKLTNNGSPRATFETTEDRLSILIHIPVHEGCGNVVVMNGDKTTEKYEMSNKMSNKEQDRLRAIVNYLDKNGVIAKSGAAKILGVENKTAQRILVKGVKLDILVSEGDRKSTTYRLK